MYFKRIALGLLVFGIAGVVSSNALGQWFGSSGSSGTNPPKKSLVDRIDGLGKSVFGKIVPPKNAQQSHSRAGHSHTSHSSHRSSQSQPRVASRPTTTRTGSVSHGSTSKSTPKRPTTVQPPMDDQPLHMRLKALRESAFDDGAMPEREPVMRKAPATATSPAKSPAPRATTTTKPVPASPTIVGTRRSPVAKHPVSAIQAADPVDRSVKIEPRPNPLQERSAPVESNPTRVADTRPANNVLLDGRAPALSVQTVGPRKISVGKESRYELTLKNSGSVAADEVVVLVNIPAWADLLGADPTAGQTQQAVGGSEPFEWRAGRVEAGARERLVLRLVPRESRPFDLAVRWNYKPVSSQVTIEVQEPKLALDLEGPRDVLYGKSEVYRLKIGNTGTGEAENVIINLTPMGSNGNQPISHTLGNLAPGAQKSIEVELTAREVGNLVIKVDVRADAGASAKLAEQVFVRRPALQVDVAGPKMQFVGTVANFNVRVKNIGTAAAKNVKMSVNLPSGAKYVSGIDNAKPVGGKLEWTLGSLEPNAEKTYSVKCSLALAGSSRFDVVSLADGDISATAGTTTQVEAMADLVLEVKDPPGPIAVGESATYELHIANRGSKSAPNVEVIAYFSEGIEPLRAEGGRNQISAGQVVFHPIPSVGAGNDIVLKVQARANTAGNHIFRAEVHCKPLGTRLVTEETTHFYSDGPTQQASFTPADNAPRQLRPVSGQEPLVSPFRGQREPATLASPGRATRLR